MPLLELGKECELRIVHYLFCKSKMIKKVISSKLPSKDLSPKFSTTFSKGKTNSKYIFGAVIFEVIETTHRRCVQYWDVFHHCFFKIKSKNLKYHHQDLWAISANVNQK